MESILILIVSLLNSTVSSCQLRLMTNAVEFRLTNDVVESQQIPELQFQNWLATLQTESNRFHLTSWAEYFPQVQVFLHQWRWGVRHQRCFESCWTLGTTFFFDAATPRSSQICDLRLQRCPPARTSAQLPFWPVKRQGPVGAGRGL